jgi:hypothetical protein
MSKKKRRKKKEAVEQKANNKEKPKKKSRRIPRKLKLTLYGIAIPLFLIYVLFFHITRGTVITRPTDDEYVRAIQALRYGTLTVRTVEDMQNLGTVAWRVVEEADLAPGTFYVHHLPQLDTKEKLRHFFHSPFTGLESIYTDIWLNSCTTYGLGEPTWGVRESKVYPAAKLSMLLILVDRLKRERSSIQEHFGAYREVLTGMELHTLQGRTRCWVILLEQCGRNEAMAGFVESQLRMRRAQDIDGAEWDFWSYVNKQPTRNAIEILASSETPPANVERQDGIQCDALYRKLLKEYCSAD